MASHGKPIFTQSNWPTSFEWTSIMGQELSLELHNWAAREVAKIKEKKNESKKPNRRVRVIRKDG
jgi:hypothetical protein